MPHTSPIQPIFAPDAIEAASLAIIDAEVPEPRPYDGPRWDVVRRLIPYWEDVIVAEGLRRGQTVLVAAHGNSLRALVKHLDGISDTDIAALNIPTGIPLVYRLDADLKPLVPGGEYLDPEAAASAAAAVANQGR